MSRPVQDVDGILLLYNFAPPYASTVMEHVGAFARHSAFPVWNVNTNEDFPDGLERFRFRAIVLHYSLFGSSEYMLGDRFREFLDASTGSLRIAFFQDEYYYCRQRFAFIDRYRIDWVYTLLGPTEAAIVYGGRNHRPRLFSTIPGYVSDELPRIAARFARPIGERRIDVGYRARALPFYMGRGAQEKTEIGRRFLELAAGYDLAVDISLTEADRLYGDDWYRFLGTCVAVLGVEAGVSIFDLDDAVREAATSLLEREPHLPFEEVSRRVLIGSEDNIYYRTISPRHLEAVAFGTCQILYEGSYSGILEAGVHYIALRKDFSNLDEVVATLRHDERRQVIVAAAHRDLVESGRYSYARFIGQFDEELRLAGVFPSVPERDASVDRALKGGALQRRIRASWRTRYRRWRDGRHAAARERHGEATR
jgi:hypothetical protein